ncbi:hypothetical protein TVNIR_2324 [Thioalkalivibrio nitratireducens DSM 14787]|uniref:GmrSD restriction endonucleases N-terminal domain-containing protein n=1 Tax=Thioalkalivibrio nitratireducens (strain DSM 14787 / UNIQEM 213 / ALEN2) TaxID=1255043 RepID=L0DY87_THIND|nr:DUF262 domain-containing protein [Thioalkalivibrio nitratireducens]AGA33967.1 hypothetical protein TVNIR_2324 [Thioalkalivibrio nitratireducens DSM 14787]
MLDPTLYGLLSQIDRDEIVLPAMQRPFVWKNERISRLIDSLLRGFPIGAVMLWRTRTVQRYRRISRDIDTGVATKYVFETSSRNDNRYLVLDGQQRLTSLYVCFRGSYDRRKLHLDVLSGDGTDKDPGTEYYDCRFLSSGEAEALNGEANGARVRFVPVSSLVNISPQKAAITANKIGTELGLNEPEMVRMADTYIRCASILGDHKSLQVITVDEDPSDNTPIEEVLEIFVRINSGGLVLLKSDLLMSLLDLKWNDIQPELQDLVREVNENRPYEFTRDDVLKSLLLAEGAETRFDRLVSDRNQVELLAENLPLHIDNVRRGWQLLGCILLDDCKISSERFFRGGHNALLPFVLFLACNPELSHSERRKLVLGIYVALMSGIFGGAEARMGVFARKTVACAYKFPLRELCELTRRHYGITSLDDLLRRHLDLALNIAHGGITLDRNPEELQRDHIFSKARLQEKGYEHEQINHYANFHFLRATDNLNKSDRPPHEWFRSPGKAPTYSDQDLAERLLTWDELEPGNFERMLDARGRRIREKAEEILGFSETEITSLFAKHAEERKVEQEDGQGRSKLSPLDSLSFYRPSSNR